MKKRNLRIVSSGFSYGALIGMLLFLVNTPSDSVLPQTLKSLLVAAICAVVSGIVITAVLFLIEICRSKIYAPFRMALASEGEIVMEDSACRLVGNRMVKGWLFLTPQSLTFYTSQKEERKILLSEIDEVRISDAKRGHVTVTTTSAESEIFALSDALAWFDAVGDSPDKNA